MGDMEASSIWGCSRGIWGCRSTTLLWLLGVPLRRRLLLLLLHRDFLGTERAGCVGEKSRQRRFRVGRSDKRNDKQSRIVIISCPGWSGWQNRLNCPEGLMGRKAKKLGGGFRRGREKGFQGGCRST